ncbi:MAG TPA: hypothetical protein ENI87_01370 [bacterium]|nr:hypothetical protein [bacterium]
MNHHPLRAATALLLCSCHGAPETAVELDRGDGALDARGFPAPASLLRGFDRRDVGGGWAVGDEVLFGLRLDKGGRRRNWLLRLRVLEPEAGVAGGDAQEGDAEWSLRVNGKLEHFASRVAGVEAVVMDEAGGVIGRSRTLLPRDFLSRGIAGACAIADRARRGLRRVPGAAAGRRPLAEATVCAISLLQVVQEDSVLAPLLWEVVEKPSVWSVVRNLGARVVLQPKFHDVRTVPSPVSGNCDATWALPIGLAVNGEPALAIELFVTDAASPYSLAGGLLGATARHPRDPGVSFSLLLLSARRALPARGEVE